MVLELLLSIVKSLLNFVFTLLPDIPDFDIDLLESLTTYMNLIFDNLGLLGFFVRISSIKILTPLVILVLTFENVYHFALWILKKIPFLGIE